MGSAEETRSLSRSLFTSRVGRGDFGLGGRLAISLQVGVNTSVRIFPFCQMALFESYFSTTGSLDDCDHNHTSIVRLHFRRVARCWPIQLQGKDSLDDQQ